jgi:hypothetical protein
MKFQKIRPFGLEEHTARHDYGNSHFLQRRERG